MSAARHFQAPAQQALPHRAHSSESAVTIRVSGELVEGHLIYLDHLIKSATECGLWALLDLQQVAHVDRAALLYLVRGEGRDFALVSCPDFIRQWIWHEHELAAA